MEIIIIICQPTTPYCKLPFQIFRRWKYVYVPMSLLQWPIQFEILDHQVLMHDSSTGQGTCECQDQNHDQTWYRLHPKPTKRLTNIRSHRIYCEKKFSFYSLWGIWYSCHRVSKCVHVRDNKKEHLPRTWCLRKPSSHPEYVEGSCRGFPPPCQSHHLMNLPEVLTGRHHSP